jgi:hypothetical protein
VTGVLDALLKRLSGLAIYIRRDERKIMQFNIVEHYEFASLKRASLPGADCSECALA